MRQQDPDTGCLTAARETNYGIRREQRQHHPLARQVTPRQQRLQAGHAPGRSSDTRSREEDVTGRLQLG